MIGGPRVSVRGLTDVETVMTDQQLLDSFDSQIAWSAKLGSAFYELLHRVLLEDFQKSGPTYALLHDWPGNPIDDALTLRLAGALNCLVRQDKAPRLSPLWPNAETAPEVLHAALVETLETHAGFVRTFLTHHVQTNETGRSAILLPGMIEIARVTQKPLALLEIGASAGLNLIWDRFRYDLGGTPWGPADAPVTLTLNWEGPKPDLGLVPDIASRAGCDISPLDIYDPAEMDRAIAYIWPDMPERIARFEAAAALARAAHVTVTQAPADQWLQTRLEARPDGAVTVLYHSIMWQYMPRTAQDRIKSLMADHGAGATMDAPLAWLAFEPPQALGLPELRLTLWPGGTTRRLAYCHPHGKDLKWTDDLL